MPRMIVTGSELESAQGALLLEGVVVVVVVENVAVPHGVVVQ